MIGDTITILQHRTQRLAKFVQADGTIAGYDAARRFDMTAAPLADLNALANLLRNLLRCPNACVVRGDIADTANAKSARRLLHRDPKTGDEPTLRDVPRRWLALDLEDVPRSPETPVTDLIACAGVAIKYLPTAFATASCIVQASGSHGFKPDIRLRMWFWCSRPMPGAELKRWLGDTPADPAVFGAAQPIYTAAPVMGQGVIDPIPHRLAILPGAPVLEVPSPEQLAPPAKRTSTQPHQIKPTQVPRYARAALVRAADRIMHASKRHQAIVAECRGLARLVQSGLLPEDDLRAVVHAAAEYAGKDDGAEIERCIAWGLANASNGNVSEASNA